MDISDQLIRVAAKLPSPKNQEYSLVITIFTKEIQEDGGRGIYYIAGTYEKEKECTRIKESLITDCGINPQHINIVKTGKWNPLMPTEETIEKKESSTSSKEEVEQRAPIDDYIYKIYLTIKNKLEVESLKKEVLAKKSKFEKYKDELIQETNSHPEFKDSWVSVLTKRMESNGETLALKQILEEYKKLDLN